MPLFGFLGRRKDDPRLHGRWRLVSTDDPGMDVGQGVEMEFTPDGKLTYTIEQETRREVFLLTYEVDGNEIVSNQPSARCEERTKYHFDDGRQLILELSGHRSVLARA